MKERTKAFALRVIRLAGSRPRDRASEVMGRQLLRSGTSVGANYRSACRSRSDKDFMARMGLVEEEADESMYWMELLVQSKLVRRELVEDLLGEADEIVRIVVASIKTVKHRTRRARVEKSAIRNPQSQI